MELIYIHTSRAIRAHDAIIALSGGLSGAKDEGHLDSILHHVQNDDYYPEFEDKLTYLVYAINKGHCFNDGNKRTSIAIGAFFLIMNGLDVLADKFIIEMENIAVAVADNLIGKELLAEVIFSLVNEADYSEELKLKIIHALSATDPIKDPPDQGAAFYKGLPE